MLKKWSKLQLEITDMSCKNIISQYKAYMGIETSCTEYKQTSERYY